MVSFASDVRRYSLIVPPESKVVLAAQLIGEAEGEKDDGTKASVLRRLRRQISARQVAHQMGLPLLASDQGQIHWTITPNSQAQVPPIPHSKPLKSLFSQIPKTPIKAP